MPPRVAPPRQLSTAALRRGTRALCVRDPDLAAVVRQFGHPPLWARRPGFPTLVRVILEQQVSLASARTMYERLRRHTGHVTPAALTGLGIAGMRDLGFTRQKAGYCHGLAARLAGGHLDLGAVSRSPDDVGQQMLLEIPGLGPWSVDIYYLMALRRPDVWPRGDLALADAAYRLKRLPARPDSLALTCLAAGWAPWRAVAARVLWHYYLSTQQRHTAWHRQSARTGGVP